MTVDEARLLLDAVTALRDARVQILTLQDELKIEREIRSVALGQLAAAAVDLANLQRANRNLRAELGRYTAATVR